jgi:hypothetical protein
MNYIVVDCLKCCVSGFWGSSTLYFIKLTAFAFVKANQAKYIFNLDSMLRIITFMSGLCLSHFPASLLIETLQRGRSYHVSLSNKVVCHQRKSSVICHFTLVQNLNHFSEIIRILNVCMFLRKCSKSIIFYASVISYF